MYEHIPDLNFVNHEEEVQAIEAEQYSSTRTHNNRLPDTQRRQQLSRDLQLPLSVQQEQVEPVDEILREFPELTASMQEVGNKQLAAGTLSNYQAAISKFQDFCADHSYQYSDITEKVVIHYIVDLNHRKVSYSVLCQVRPALTLLQEWHNGVATVFTDRVTRILDGALRAAAERKPPVKKAGEVPFQWLEDTVKQHFWKSDEVDTRSDPYTCRTVFRVVFEYFTFCRFADFQKLQARHIQPVGTDLLVTFPTAKNDQMHNGQTTILKANGTDMCPVRITHKFCQIVGLKIGSDHKDSRHLHCRIRKQAGGWAAVAGGPASASKAREELAKLLRSSGMCDKGITDKSFKMLGVTRMMEAGASADETALHGRWRTPSMPLRYKHNSTAFKTAMAAKVPFSGSIGSDTE